jgi:hypothetical protein
MEKKGKLIEEKFWLYFYKEEFGKEIYKINNYIMLGGSDFEELIKECKSKKLSFIIDLSTHELIVQKY